VQRWPDSPQQQQQQQQQQQHILPSQLQPTLQPAIALAAAILSTAGPAATAAAAAATAAAAGSSSSSLMDVETLMGIQTSRMEALECVEASDKAVLAADAIVTSMMEWLGKLDGCREQQQQQLAPLVSQDLLLLVVTRFAFVLALLYTLTKGASPWACGSSSSSSSSSSRRPAQQPQHMQVPPYHEQLLSCLGVVTSEQLPAALQECMTSTLALQHTTSLQLLKRLLQVDLSLPQQQQQQQQQQRPRVLDSQVAPLLLCCVEAALLAPSPRENAPAGLLRLMTSCFLANSIEAASAIVFAAADDDIRLPIGVAVQVTEQFAGPVLQLLAPAVRQLLRLALGKQQQQQQEEMERSLSSEQLWRQADLCYKTSDMWSDLVYWIAAAAGVC
jgi:hypothetical protein